MNKPPLQELVVDRAGLVWAYRFHAGVTSEISPSGELAQLLTQHLIDPAGKLLWLHFNLSQASTERWLREHTPLPPEFFEALQQGSRSTRVEQVDDALLAVVNDVLHGFTFDPSETSTLWMYITPTLLISARKKPLKSVDRLRQAMQAGASVTSTTELLTHLLRDQADVLIGIVRDTVTRVDKIEDDLLAGRLDSKRSNLGQLRRVLVRLQRLMAPEPAALFRLLQRPPDWIAEDDLQDLRQSSEEFSAVLNDMASLQERIKLLQEEIAAMINERNSKSLYTLTVFTVVALPINLIAGLFGMNVAGIPLADHPHGFWMVVALILVISGAALWRLLHNSPD
ncbi:MAG: magnesium transporter CorA [Oxalobacteraceae bacterium]|nr:magnesium transporter CorA [Oxalobacteraceae bacterium]